VATQEHKVCKGSDSWHQHTLATGHKVVHHQAQQSFKSELQ
jgi:hypothetical protein